MDNLNESTKLFRGLRIIESYVNDTLIDLTNRMYEENDDSDNESWYEGLSRKLICAKSVIDDLFKLESKEINIDNQVWSAAFDLAYDRYYNIEYEVVYHNEYKDCINSGMDEKEAKDTAHRIANERAISIAGCKATDEACEAVEAWVRIVS